MKKKYALYLIDEINKFKLNIVINFDIASKEQAEQEAGEYLKKAEIKKGVRVAIIEYYESI